MNANDTDSHRNDLSGTAGTVLATTARSAIKRTVRTLATAKNYRRTAAMNAAIQAKNSAAFFEAWSKLSAEAADLGEKNES